MPEIQKEIYIKVTPEQFLQACSDNELREVDLLIQSPRFAKRLDNNLTEIKGS